MARRDRMRFRQPDMRRNNAGFRAKADQRQDEDQRGQPGIGLQDAAISIEIGTARGLPKHHEGDQQERRSQVGCCKVGPGGMAHRRFPVIEND